MARRRRSSAGGGLKLLINAREAEESRIAVLRAGRLEEYYIERQSLGSTLGNIYKGLAASGSWGCFDEFNRLVPEVLSVCTVQFKSVCDALRANRARFILQGDEINLDVNVGCFITMNPGYLGRSELPEGLKAPPGIAINNFVAFMKKCILLINK